MTTMTDTDLDALLAAPLPERDAGIFCVALMERIAHDQARPARILSWVSVGVLFVVVTAACLAAARFLPQADSIAVPAALSVLTLILSFTVMQAARA